MNRKTFTVAALVFVTCSVAWADQALQSAQEKLKEQGFYYGEINGKQDADTTAAIRRYQIRNGLQVTGNLNAETQQALGLSAKPAASPKPRPAQTPGPTPPGFLQDTQPPAATPAPRSAPPQDDVEAEPGVAPDAPPPRLDGRAPFAATPYEAAPPRVQQDILMQAQVRLMRRGYYRDEIDGLYGPALNFALRNFQARFGLEPTGRFDVETLAALELLPEQRVTHYPRSPRHFFPPWMHRGPGGERIYIPR